MIHWNCANANLSTSNVGAVNVVHTRTNFIRVREVAEGGQQLHVRARGLNGNDVRVQCRNAGHDVVEFGIAHVRMDLCAVANTADGEAKTGKYLKEKSHQTRK